MGIMPDLITSATEDLLPEFTESFTKFNPLFDHIIKRGKQQKIQSYVHEFVITPSGPGFISSPRSGAAVIPSGLRQNSLRGTVHTTRSYYAWEIPGADLALASGDDDVVNLIKKYPKVGLSEFYKSYARQLAVGKGVVDGFTFNSEQTYNPRGVQSENGVFEYEAPASQSNSTFGITKSVANGWYHQYRHITNFRTNGRKQMRALYFDASQELEMTDGEMDIIFADRGTFDNYLADLDEDVRFVSGELQDRNKDKAVRRGVPFLGATMYPEYFLKPEEFTDAIPQSGVAYFLHSATWTLLVARGNSDKATKGFFDLNYVGRMPTQDLHRWEYVTDIGLYSNNLRCNGVLTGGANLS